MSRVVSEGGSLADALRGVVGADRVVAGGPVADWSPLAMKGVFAPGEGEPELAVTPGDAGEVAAVLAACAARGVAVTPRGAGSGVLGGAVPAGGVLLDLSRLDGIGAVDRENHLVRAGAGVLGSVLEAAVREQGFTLGLYPQSLELASVGGWVATRASGTYSGHYGGVEARLAGLEVALADGTVCRTPEMPRWAVGPDLAALFLGSEGALGVVTAVTLRVDPLPERRLLRAVRFPTLEDGLGAVREIAQGGIHPAVVRLYDAPESERLRATIGHDGDGCVLLLGFDGPARLAELQEDLALERAVAHGAADLGREPATRWDAHRLAVPSGFRALAEPGIMADYIDVQAPWSRVEAIYAAVRDALAAHCTSVMAHFSHVYPQGTSIYFVVSIAAEDDAAAVARHAAAWRDAMAACMAAGGTVAHHHGIGRVRAPWTAATLGDSLPIWRRLRRAFDPAGILAPGVIDPREPADG